MIDNENSIDVLFYDALSKINLIDQLKQIGILLIRFSENLILVEEETILPVTAEWKPKQSMVQFTFLVLKVSSAYNAILD